MKASKNQMYEDLIEEMMIEEVSVGKPAIKDMLMNCEPNKRRLAILSILDNGRELFKEIKNIIVDAPSSQTKHIKNVVTMMREYVKVADVEKKTLGEVMTPNSLVNNMLDTLPVDVWSNPDLKWLDPCAGVGIFPAVIVDRLMDGLYWFETDDVKRYKHIMENMIYVCEYQQKNAFLYLCAFDSQLKENNALNIYCGSFLDENFDNHAKNVWGIEKFDIIVMNPPYQELKEGNKKSQALWHLFVEKTLRILVDAGYLVAVHPSGWRNVDGAFKNIQKLMLSKDMLYLEIHNEKDGLKTFGAETRYDFYCIKNTKTDNFLTRIKCQDGAIENINISNMQFIPNNMFKLLTSLLSEEKENTVKIIANSSYHTQHLEYMSKEQTEEFVFPCVYTVKSGDEVTLWYSNTNLKGHFCTPKLIWSNFRISSAGSFVDNDGSFGLTQFAYAIVDDVANLENVKKAFDNKEFRKLMEACAVSDMSINRKIIATFRKDFWKEFVY